MVSSLVTRLTAITWDRSFPNTQILRWKNSRTHPLPLRTQTKLVGPGTRVSHGWAGTRFNFILQRKKELVLRRKSRRQREQELGLQWTEKISVCLLHPLQSESLSHTHRHTLKGDVHSLLPRWSYLTAIFVSPGNIATQEQNLLVNWSSAVTLSRGTAKTCPGT